MLSVSFVILWFVNRGVLVYVQISNRVSLQLIPEEPLSYDNFLKVCEEKQQSEWATLRSNAAAAESSPMNPKWKFE